MKLNQPHYIEKRRGNAHIDLDGTWEFCWEDEAREDISALGFSYTTEIPSSVYYSLYHAGILPDPYYGTNSKLYHWADEKVWYYRKRFTLDCPNFCGNAFLCFEGIAYYSRIWVNGVLLGDHEGMFGGPVVDVADILNTNGENEIVAEVKSCNFGRKDHFDCWNGKGENREIAPWNVSRDTYTSNGDFIVVGIWNRVRLELVPKIHISRPYLYTESVDGEHAVLRFEAEISDGSIGELSSYGGSCENHSYYCFSFTDGLAGAVQGRSVFVTVSICDNDGEVYSETEEVPLVDSKEQGRDPRYCGLQFYRRRIEIENPKLWYPNGLGEAHLYDVSVTLSYEGEVQDEHRFKTGIRSFAADYTTGGKYDSRWGKFLFSINGRAFFLKGMNWMPIDFLYDISPERYEWCLTMAKNEGIQLIRVWNGGGMPENDVFYELCDKLGLLVWQDLFIANSQSQGYPQDVLEAQTAYNLYRMRNHTSLVLLCGGNEINPYSVGNAASMFVMERTVKMLTPDRIFHYTTPDGGSAHIYLDMEPVWYRHRYSELPFLAESGIHSFPNFNSIKLLMNSKEATGVLPELTSERFCAEYPDLLNHFTEYIPSRVPRMTARISQIIDMKNITLEELCEASHVQSYEFYQTMIQSMQENYPRCGGVMPWVFKRPWTTTAVQTVDGNDLPTLAYYAVQNSYRPLNLCWCQQWSVLAPGEELSLAVNVFNQNAEDLSDTRVTLTVYNPDLTAFAEYTAEYDDTLDFGKVTLDEGFTDTCFLVSVDLVRGEKVLARSTYFNKCTSVLCDESLYQKYRNAPTENLRLDNGPWLKHSLNAARPAALQVVRVGEGQDGRYEFVDICIKNIFQMPAFPVTVNLEDDRARFFLDDNFFLLKSGEQKTVRLTCREGSPKRVRVAFWNGDHVVV